MLNRLGIIHSPTFPKEVNMFSWEVLVACYLWQVREIWGESTGRTHNVDLAFTRNDVRRNPLRAILFQ
jgi:hypothetical protein